MIKYTNEWNWILMFSNISKPNIDWNKVTIQECMSPSMRTMHCFIPLGPCLAFTSSLNIPMHFNRVQVVKLLEFLKKLFSLPWRFNFFLPFLKSLSISLNSPPSCTKRFDALSVATGGLKRGVCFSERFLLNLFLKSLPWSVLFQ